MKIIKYNRCTRVTFGQKENLQVEDFLSSVQMPWSKENEEIAKKEAYNGEYTIEDDGRPEPVVEPSADDVLNTLLGV